MRHGRGPCASFRSAFATGSVRRAHSTPSVLFAQSIHERPIVGGFVARLSPDITRKYLATPVIGSLLRLSAGEPLSGEATLMDPVSAAAQLTSLGIVYVVVDTRRAPPDLIRYVRSAIALNLVGEEDGRAFYEVASGSAARDGASHGSSRRPAQPAKKLEEQVGVTVQPVLRQVGRRDEQAGARDHPALKNQMFRHGVPGLERIGDARWPGRDRAISAGSRSRPIPRTRARSALYRLGLPGAWGLELLNGDSEWRERPRGCLHGRPQRPTPLYPAMMAHAEGGVL